MMRLRSAYRYGMRYVGGPVRREVRAASRASARSRRRRGEVTPAAATVTVIFALIWFVIGCHVFLTTMGS